MIATGGAVPSAYEKNPFSPIAVAKVTESDRDPVTVDTPTIEETIAIVRAYLADPVAPGSNADSTIMRQRGGTVLAVVGEYGTGKTHLVMRLMRYARDNNSGGRIRWVYVDATAGGFLAVYRRFVENLDLKEIREQVMRYYAHVVADSLGNSGLTARIVHDLRHGATDPIKVVEQLSLMESSLLNELLRRLRRVTDNVAFGTALMLLLRKGFESHAWAWLEGREPDPILAERGITVQIDNDVAALEAMGVIALLYSGGDGRFLLAIDELDRVLSAATTPGTNVLAAFKKLLEIFNAADAMLVLSGLPDFLDVISGDIQERIGPVVRMSPMTGRQVSTFIEAIQEQELGVRTLAPFREDSVEYLVRSTQGIARQAIRLCYYAFGQAMTDNTEVTPELVEKVARAERFLQTTDAEVHGAVAQVLDRNGWPYVRNHYVGTNRTTKVDYWITPAGTDSGYGVLVSGSVLDDDDVAALRDVATAIADANESARPHILLVVNGYLPAEQAAEIDREFGIPPLVYQPRAFPVKFASALTSMTQRLLAEPGGDDLAQVTEQVERINRQQSNTRGYIERVEANVVALRASTDLIVSQLQRLMAMQADATGGADAVGEAADVSSGPEMPTDVDRSFTEAFDALSELDRFDGLLKVAFDPAESSARSAMRSMIRSRLLAPSIAPAAGVATLLRSTVVVFRDGVVDWYRTYLSEQERGTAANGPSDADRHRLDVLCSTYDAISEYLPTFHMLALSELVAPSTEERDPLARTDRLRRVSRSRDVLENLSVRVRQGMLTAVTPAD